MQPEVESLLDLAASIDSEVQHSAIVQLAMLLDKSNDGSSFTYANFLSPELLEIDLDWDEQAEIVQGLAALLATNRRAPSMFWAISKAAPLAGIDTLLDLISYHGQKFDDATARQAVLALDSFLLPETAYEMQASDALWFLQSCSRSENSDLAAAAQQVLDNFNWKISHSW